MHVDRLVRHVDDPFLQRGEAAGKREAVGKEASLVGAETTGTPSARLGHDKRGWIPQECIRRERFTRLRAVTWPFPRNVLRKSFRSNAFLSALQVGNCSSPSCAHLWGVRACLQAHPDVHDEAPIVIAFLEESYVLRARGTQQEGGREEARASGRGGRAWISWQLVYASTSLLRLGLIWAMMWFHDCIPRVCFL